MAAGPDLLAMLGATPVAEAMRGSAWLYPIVEIVHIVGFSVLVGSVAMFDLRVLGFARSVPVLAAGRMLLPWSVASLLVIVPAGLLLFSAHPLELSMNKVFQLKLLLIALAGLNALGFHFGVYRAAATWQAAAPPLARLHAAASLALWISVISCGRLLAYT
jgi:hypothetical protein